LAALLLLLLLLLAVGAERVGLKNCWLAMTVLLLGLPAPPSAAEANATLGWTVAAAAAAAAAAALVPAASPPCAASDHTVACLSLLLASTAAAAGDVRMEFPLLLTKKLCRKSKRTATSA
jgi:hypothetical protein